MWNEAVAVQCKEIILRGGSVDKATAKVAPKGFLSKIRSSRRELLAQQTGTIYGNLQQQGYVVTRMSEKHVAARTGDESFTLVVTKRAETEADRLRKEVAELRALLGMAEARVSGAPVNA
ncbi:MAG: hypothetical protein P4M10_01745 [Verrucomicrobiae bacterium]|nr:hypothetical protein [Verrucomicrobiae bacterium]